MTKVTNFFTNLMHKYLPDPFVIAIVLTVFTVFLAIIVEGTGFTTAVEYWGNGFWDLLAFTMQMTIILVGGYVLANTPLAERLINALVTRIHRPQTAVAVATLVGAVGSWLNWGFGLVIGGLVAAKLATRIRGVHYPLIIAAAYSGFALYGLGLSGSIPLLISTPDHFMQDEMGIVPLSGTIFSWPMLLTSLTLIVTLPILNAMLHPKSESEIIEIDPSVNRSEQSESDQPFTGEGEKPTTLAENMNQSRIIGMGIGLIGLLYVVLYFVNGNALTLNTVNFTVLFLGIVLMGTPARYFEVLSDGIKIVAGIVLQYPFYAGIMGILSASGLVATFASGFVSISSAQTLPLWSVASAYFVNILAPSAGGQWAVQGPIMIAAAQELGASLEQVAMGVQMGDAWNNLIQPFWLLPVIAISGLKLKDIMGYTVVMMFWVGIVVITAFSLWSFLG